jgi:hypothetical protein
VPKNVSNVVGSRFGRRNNETDQNEELTERETRETLIFFTDQVLSLFKPLSATFVLVSWFVASTIVALGPTNSP